MEERFLRFMQLSKAQQQEIKSALTGLPELFVTDHVERLDAEYFNRFSLEEIRAHIHAITTLSPDRLSTVFFTKSTTEDLYHLTVVGFDFHGLFSLIAGLLTLYGFDIRAGVSFTYAPALPAADAAGSKETRYYREKKKIIDTFSLVYIGTAAAPSDTTGAALEKELNDCCARIKQNCYEDVRADINKRISSHLASIRTPAQALLPVEIDITSADLFTVLHISGQDTPAFLYALSNAITLKGLMIHKVKITTSGSRVDDLIYITDRQGKPLTQKSYLDKLKAAVVLIKQGTLLLPAAPDPALAIRQFDMFIDELISDNALNLDLPAIKNEDILTALMKIFGTGEYFWEEFVRMQYQTLLPFLQHIDAAGNTFDREALTHALQNRLAAAGSFEKRIEVINEFKDRYLFQADLLHLIYPQKTFIEFSEKLNTIAEVTIIQTAETIYGLLKNNYGAPHAGGSPCGYALFALGKFGSKELGYASDIEMVLIYEQNGMTEGAEAACSNQEFFNLFVEQLRTHIHAKKEGIFELDLRLRPEGNKGQLSCSLRRWEEYYAPAGHAYDYERQALTKLRPIFGDQRLCEKVCALRDTILYGETPVSIENTLELRAKQIEKLLVPNQVNAKFSIGGLVDIEYAVQFLQLSHGHAHPKVRTPNTINALEALFTLQIITPTEFEKLYNSYAFLRRLINALRMVRGNAKDLIIPPYGSDEFVFLAKRLGYVHKKQIVPADQLAEDITTTLSSVAVFYRGRFIDKQETVYSDIGIPELLIRDDIAEPLRDALLKKLHCRDTHKAYRVLKNLMHMLPERHCFITVFVLAERFIMRSPDPDKAIINLEKYLRATDDPTAILTRMIFNPQYIELLITTFGYSDYLTDILITEPYLIQYIAEEHSLFMTKSWDHHAREIIECCEPGVSLENKMDRLRQYRNKEILRIGLRDVYLRVSLEQTVRELSTLTTALVHYVYLFVLKHLNKDTADHQNGQTVIALGKLGGYELNYSSDIDIAFIVSDTLPDAVSRDEFTTIDHLFISHLTATSRFGKLFRVDTRLRPYGRFGSLTGTVAFYKKYYAEKAAGWELQAWLKARPITGNRDLGRSVVAAIQTIMLAEEKQVPIFESIAKVRAQMLAELKRQHATDTEVKLGRGGIRAIEFYVQHHQIKYGAVYSDIISGHTLQALEKLYVHHLVDDATYITLRKAYIFLREIEHRIQLLGLQQEHELPADKNELYLLAKRMRYEDLLHEDVLAQFTADYKKVTDAVARIAESIQSN